VTPPTWLRPVPLAPLRGSTYVRGTVYGNVGYRVPMYRWWVRDGYFPDLRAAVRWNVRAGHEYRRKRDEQEYRRRQHARLTAPARLAREVLFSWPRRCHYCGARATHADHVIPRCQDGPDEFDNLAPACARCNLQKGGRTPEQWRAWCAATGRPWPPPGAVWTRGPDVPEGQPRPGRPSADPSPRQEDRSA
jgi:5-methylcytosine-specific restriction endonuclease McrA